MGAGKRGSAYLLVVIVGVTLGAAAIAAFSFSMSRNRNSEVAVSSSKTKSIAEGASEAAAKQLMDAIAAYDYANVPSAGNPINITIDVDGLDVTCTLAEAVVDQQVTTDAVGIQTILKQYSITAVTSQSDADSPLTDTPSRVITVYELLQTPLFQFAVFYNEDLEMLPGPSMTLSGRVHSNADMYLATNSGSTFSIDSNYCRAAGSIYRQRKDDGSVPTGTVRVKDDTGAYVNWASGVDSDSATWYQQALDNWGDGSLSTSNDSVMSDVHGVTTLSTPQVQNMDPGGYYHTEAENNSGIVIEYTGGSPTILVDGIDVTATANTIAGGAILATANNMSDNRENTTTRIQTIDIDQSRMNTFISGYFGTVSHPEKFSGLMYAYRTDTTPSDPRAFRMLKAARLPQAGASHANAAGGLTVVTPNPVYLWQDYNTGAAVPVSAPPAGVPANYTGDEASAANKVPAAVIADAVNLLSNRWDNSKTPGGALPSGAKLPIKTVYNTAMITGNVKTEGAAYSGGLENLPRFHENWSGVTAKFRGSFVSLFESQYADGAWVYGGNRYNAPTRDWNYDTSFNDVDNLPPYTPSAIGMNRQVFTQQAN